MKIYTKTGDKGETSLHGGERVPKDDLRIHAYGTVDELNSILGIASLKISSMELKEVIKGLQNELFIVGADLATPELKKGKKLIVDRVDDKLILKLEKIIDDFNSRLPELQNFILPGGSEGASFLHLARTVCRRAEREVVNLANNVDTGKKIIIYLNRLSDLLFVLARFENYSSNHPDIEWKK
ncbi:MAG: cob(I)yrinic acid a,c-diamide adenosyltransferase [Ignavibacteria bacterium]|nr:cob(I)yrinic acid a,c-diamide adenosyltransferase [Ignavibacteria bacterium]